MKQRMGTQAAAISRWWLATGWLLAGCWLVLGSAVYAHGTEVEAESAHGMVVLNAKFDTGEPMSDAQILIYAPADPQNSWQKGVADEQGRYQFAIDREQVGDWSINIRTAGHGQWVYLTVDNGGNVAVNDADGRDGWVKWGTAGAVVAGLLGVAAWYRRPTEKFEGKV